MLEKCPAVVTAGHLCATLSLPLWSLRESTLKSPALIPASGPNWSGVAAKETVLVELKQGGKAVFAPALDDPWGEQVKVFSGAFAKNFDRDKAATLIGRDAQGTELWRHVVPKGYFQAPAN
ncbi:hypothetical protein ACFFOP_07820 [Sinosporangium siamense]|uniref:hypothetical protein n=1 Tax=Sinosporangium siamense TaxID=1367973 RepID=UPI0035ED95C1